MMTHGGKLCVEFAMRVAGLVRIAIGITLETWIWPFEQFTTNSLSRCGADARIPVVRSCKIQPARSGSPVGCDLGPRYDAILKCYGRDSSFAATMDTGSTPNRAALPLTLYNAPIPTHSLDN